MQGYPPPQGPYDNQYPQPGQYGPGPGPYIQQQPGFQQGYQPGPMGPQPGYQPGPMGPQPGYQPGPMGPQPGFQQGPMGPPPGFQPEQQQMMPLLKPDNCPEGLEYLTQLNHLIVKQKVELAEVFLSFETKNKYVVKNAMGQPVYRAKEDTDCCTRNCCGPIRPFNMMILDNFEKEVIHLHRPLRCQSCWCPCCLQSLEVSSPPGNVIGKVEQNWSILGPKFSVKDANGETGLIIKGPFCTYAMCGDVEFKVMTPDGSTEVGKISKQWTGLLREAFTDADNFGISFPMDLDVRAKATLLGAMFLIDFMFFEKSRNEESDGLGML